MRVRVTQEDIDQGMPCRCNECPVALALIRDGLFSPLVGSLDLEVAGQLWDLPEEAQRFIQRFDSRWEVEPFEFDMFPVKKEEEHAR